MTAKKSIHFFWLFYLFFLYFFNKIRDNCIFLHVIHKVRNAASALKIHVFGNIPHHRRIFDHSHPDVFIKKEGTDPQLKLCLHSLFNP